MNLDDFIITGFCRIDDRMDSHADTAPPTSTARTHPCSGFRIGGLDDGRQQKM